MTKPFNPLRNVRDYIELPLLYEHWYVAGLRSEFTRELSAKTLLKRSIVFYRREDGTPVALQNRCVHRSFPLAKSRLIGDDIQCGYHGIRYNSDGQIVDIPCQTKCPATTLQKYPVVEQGPFLWIWMGDPAAADPANIPQTNCLSSPDWSAIWGRKTLEGNYLLMHENLADLSHLPFLHEQTFGADDSWAEVPVEIEREGDMVHYWRSTTQWEMAAPLYPPTLDLRGRDLQAKLGATFVSPAMCRGWSTVVLNDPGKDDQKALETEINHYLTPLDHGNAHYYWSFARNCDIANEDYSKQFAQVVDAAFDEDRVATKDMQELLDSDTHDFPDLFIAGDQSSMMVRKVVNELARRVAAG
ncbi:MAG: aromatic ring-hydroxylating dioxygenase subunit alpha [Pseudomonadota bacterium]